MCIQHGCKVFHLMRGESTYQRSSLSLGIIYRIAWKRRGGGVALIVFWISYYTFLALSYKPNLLGFLRFSTDLNSAAEIIKDH